MQGNNEIVFAMSSFCAHRPLMIIEAVARLFLFSVFLVDLFGTDSRLRFFLPY
jgi:hypothetical protein